MVNTATSTEVGAGSAGLDREQLLRLYREIVIIRRTEEQLARSYAQGHIPGAWHAVRALAR